MQALNFKPVPGLHDAAMVILFTAGLQCCHHCIWPDRHRQDIHHGGGAGGAAAGHHPTQVRHPAAAAAAKCYELMLQYWPQQHTQQIAIAACILGELIMLHSLLSVQQAQHLDTM
jgi:hypothetical protein